MRENERGARLATGREKNDIVSLRTVMTTVSIRTLRLKQVSSMNDDVAILWDVPIHTDKATGRNRPDIEFKV